MFFEAILVIGTIIAISTITYSCLATSSNSEEQAEEDFKAFLEEKERVKNGRHNQMYK